MLTFKLGEQQALRFPSKWGGARVGAGRPKSQKKRSYVPHVARPAVARSRPHHVTVKFVHGTWNLRSQRCFRPIRDALATVKRERAGVRIVQFTVQHNHLHLIVEADDRASLSGAMRSLLIRVARGVNAVMGARGRRVRERYHEHILRTPAEARNALRYVLRNRDHHLAQWAAPRGPELDEFGSIAHRDVVRAAASWLLREGWTRAGPL
jgi:REP element-mobilizing transposase RayT